MNALKEQTADVQTLRHCASNCRNPAEKCLSCPSRNSLLCSGFEDDELATVAMRGRMHEIDRGETLILEGDPSNHVYNIVSGDLMISRLTQDGRRQVLDFLGGGDFLGLTIADTYQFHAEALTKSTVCRLSRNDLQDLLERFPAFDRQFHRLTAAALDERADQVFTLGRRTALERVAAFLLHQSARQGLPDRPSNHLRLPMTRGDIADFLGLTLETVSRAFSKLKREHIIRLETPHAITVLDREALETVADKD